MKLSHFVLGIATGAAIGAASVLLSTPSSGNDVRSQLKQNTQNLKLQLSDVKNESSNVIQSITVLSNEIKNNIPTIINELKTSFQTFQKEIEPNTALLKNELEQLNNSIQDIQRNVNDFNKKEEKTSETITQETNI